VIITHLKNQFLVRKWVQVGYTLHGQCDLFPIHINLSVVTSGIHTLLSVMLTIHW